jgi:hypothetical protein
MTERKRGLFDELNDITKVLTTPRSIINKVEEDKLYSELLLVKDIAKDLYKEHLHSNVKQSLDALNKFSFRKHVYRKSISQPFSKEEQHIHALVLEVLSHPACLGGLYNKEWVRTYLPLTLMISIRTFS